MGRVFIAAACPCSLDPRPLLGPPGPEESSRAEAQGQWASGGDALFSMGVGKGRGQGRGGPDGVSGGGTQYMGRMERERVGGGAIRHGGSTMARVPPLEKGPSPGRSGQGHRGSPCHHPDRGRRAGPEACLHGPQLLAGNGHNGRCESDLCWGDSGLP